MSNWIYLAVFAVAIAIYAMINILMVRFSTYKKMCWFAIVTLIPVLGPLVYFLAIRHKANSGEGQG